MPIEFDVKLTSKDMYRFNMYQMYSGFNGWFSIIISIFIFVVAFVTFGDVEMTYTVLYVAFGIIFLLYAPVSLYLRSKHSLLTSPVLSRPLHYLVDDKGFTVSQEEESATLPWDMIYKLVATRNNVLVYSNRTNAYVIPREQLGDDYEKMAELATEKLPKYRLKIKAR